MTNVNTDEGLMYDISDELKKKTDAYPVVDVKMLPVPTTSVPDIATGGDRKRKFGLYMAIAVIPDLDQQHDPVILNGDIPGMFFDGDSLDDVLERSHAELDAVIEATKERLEEFRKKIKESGQNGTD